jgi:hypothetical protein
LRHHRFILVLAALGLIIAAPMASSAHAQTHAGSITNLSGAAKVTRAGNSLPAVSGAPVEVGDNIATGPNGNVTITLTDGSQIELSGDSTVVIEENRLDASGARTSTRLGLLQGLVRSMVRVTAGTAPNFEVHTPNAVASARGTIFDVSYEKGVAR